MTETCDIAISQNRHATSGPPAKGPDTVDFKVNTLLVISRTHKKNLGDSPREFQAYGGGH